MTEEEKRKQWFAVHVLAGQETTALTLTQSAGNANGVTYWHPDQHNVPNPGALLMQKVQYAHQRWGATLFYVDSTVDYSGVTEAAADFKASAVDVDDQVIAHEGQ